MGQKVHPTALRLYKTNRLSSSAWFSRLYYKEIFVKDWFLKKIATKFLHQSKYITPKIFTSFWNRRCQIFIFFLSRRKEYKKILFRFQSFLQKKIKVKKKKQGEQSPLVFFPGKKYMEYTKFLKLPNPIENYTKKLKKHKHLKNKLEQFLWQKFEYDKKYQ